MSARRSKLNPSNQMEPKVVGAFEAKTHLSALLDEVENGGVVIITRHSKPIAEFHQPTTVSRPKFGSAHGKEFHMADDFDAHLDDFGTYMT